MGISITGGVKLPQGKFSVYTPPPPPGYALFVWGSGSAGKLGLGDVVSQSSPVQLGALVDWSDSSAGNRGGFAINSTGELWAWGDNTNGVGVLGLGDEIDRSSPVQVGSLTDWASIASGGYHAHGIKTDGSLWSWGRNSFGMLALNDTVNRSSPSQVGSLTNWASVSARGSYNLAIKTDGTLWSWGQNNQGQLGLKNVVLRSSPVQIGNLTTWASATMSGNGQAFAIKTDNTLWTWGNNSGVNSRLGLGDQFNRSSPVQLGILSDWANVSSNHTHALALKTDGTIWTWGENFRGQLGLGDEGDTDRSSPVQIGLLTDWASVGTGTSHSAALKTDGTLWGWGQGNFIGHGLAFPDGNRSSPVQVGSLTTWTSLKIGSNHTQAIQLI